MCYAASIHLYLFYYCRAEDWGGLDGHNCYQETEPITREGYSRSGSKSELMRVVEAAICRLWTRGLNVQILNITQLLEYRKDAHPSIYKRQWHSLSSAMPIACTGVSQGSPTFGTSSSTPTFSWIELPGYKVEWESNKVIVNLSVNFGEQLTVEWRRRNFLFQLKSLVFHRVVRVNVVHCIQTQIVL